MGQEALESLQRLILAASRIIHLIMKPKCDLDEVRPLDQTARLRLIEDSQALIQMLKRVIGSLRFGIGVQQTCVPCDGIAIAFKSLPQGHPVIEGRSYDVTFNLTRTSKSFSAARVVSSGISRSVLAS